MQTLEKSVVFIFMLNPVHENRHYFDRSRRYIHKWAFTTKTIFRSDGNINTDFFM